MWRATRTSEGPATVAVEGRDRILARAWGPGAAQALDLLPQWLGFDDDPGALQPKDDVVARAQRAHPGLRLGRGRPIFEVLVPIIIGQRVTTQEASDSWRHLVFTHGEKAPGPCRLHVPPRVEALRRIGLPSFHRFGIEGARARVILDVCHHQRFVERIPELPPSEAIRKLRMFRGIGPWTSHLTAALVMGYADALPLGDFHIPSVVAQALAGEERASDRRMVELLEPYRGQRWRVIRLVGADTQYATRRHPRRAPWRVQVELATARRERRARAGASDVSRRGRRRSRG
jgi:3-methyladenine DNA glycosylase/8-oxoguanine DNA glycosylase